MELAHFQRDFVNKIYQALTSEDSFSAVNLSGGPGSGKTSIAMGVVRQLMEGWHVFVITGVDSELSPYFTWHIGTSLFSHKESQQDKKISLGINFMPISVSMELTKVPKASTVLTPSEDALLSAIKQQAGASENILIIADDYEQWDIPSKQFLKKLIIPELALLSPCRTVVLFLTQERLDLPNAAQFFIETISDDDLLFVLRQQGCSGHIKLDNVRSCAGSDLSLATMTANYFASDASSDVSFNQIMDSRRKALSVEGQAACAILEPLSLVGPYFSTREATLFVSDVPMDQVPYQADAYLCLAQDERFIVGQNPYCFLSQQIQEYFQSKVVAKRQYYHKMLAVYLKEQCPADYFNRGRHMEASLRTNDTTSILETWQLLFLAYVRQVSQIGNLQDPYHLFERIENLIARLPAGIAKAQRYVLEQLRKGHDELFHYQYRAASATLQAITPSQLVAVCRCECQRWILLCHVQMAEIPAMIRTATEELYDLIQTPDFQEDEQYCRSALVLMDVYLDRINDAEKMRTVKSEFIKMTQKHMECLEFMELEACFNRKASLHYAAPIALQQTAQSVRFYQEHYNFTGLYMSLCNHAGNAIICGEYEQASLALDQCDMLTRQKQNHYWPSGYKLKNNRILLDYLVQEAVDDGNSENLRVAAKYATDKLADIVDRQDDEISRVVLFNCIGLSILGSVEGWDEKLQLANQLMPSLDVYYQYYLHDLNFAVALLRGDAGNAKEELEQLKLLDVPLMYMYEQIFFQRRRIQESLLCDWNGAPLSAIDYHQIMAAGCRHIQDPSCHFWGRGFLLSDLQFLSF